MNGVLEFSRYARQIQKLSLPRYYMLVRKKDEARNGLEKKGINIDAVFFFTCTTNSKFSQIQLQSNYTYRSINRKGVL